MLLPLLFGLVAVTGRAADDQPKSLVFLSEAGKFSVTLPAKPKKQTTKTPSAVGQLEVNLFLVDLNDKAFIASYTDYPKGTVTDANRQAVLDGVRNGNVKGGKGKLASETKITVGKEKLEGRELLIEKADIKGFYRARILIRGDRLYQVIAIGAGDWAKTDTVTKYLDSFELEE
jgi:hypothetical protein